MPPRRVFCWACMTKRFVEILQFCNCVTVEMWFFTIWANIIMFPHSSVDSKLNFWDCSMQPITHPNRSPTSIALVLQSLRQSWHSILHCSNSPWSFVYRSQYSMQGLLLVSPKVNKYVKPGSSLSACRRASSRASFLWMPPSTASLFSKLSIAGEPRNFAPSLPWLAPTWTMGNTKMHRINRNIIIMAVVN